MTLDMLDLAGAIVGTLLTMLILSYFFLGDTFFYRLALHILVGATAGYGVAVVSVTVLLRIVLPALQGEAVERYSMIVPLVLGILLLFKGFPRWSSVGNLSTAFLIGVGSAVAVAGALLGTIMPQVSAAGALDEWIDMGPKGLVNGLLVTIGTACVLLAFTFALPRQRSLRGLWNSTVGLAGRIGRGLLLAAFGAAFAAALTASLSVLVSRIYSIVDSIQLILQSFGG